MSWFSDLLYPPRCVICRKFLPNSRVSLCEDCSKWQMRNKTLFFRGKQVTLCVSPLPYEEPFRASFHRFKFKGARFYARHYAPWLAACITQEAPDWDILTWVPISRRRRRERGYDQTRDLARETAKLLGVRAEPCLRKIQNNPAQSGIRDREARLANVKGAYAPLHPEQWQGKRILLIDDIITTGATMEECAKVLRRAGAASVCGATLASAN